MDNNLLSRMQIIWLSLIKPTWVLSPLVTVSNYVYFPLCELQWWMGKQTMRVYLLVLCCFRFVSSEINLYKRTSTARPVLPSPEFFSPAVVDNSRAWNRMSQEEHFPMTPIPHTAGNSFSVSFIYCLNHRFLVVFLLLLSQRSGCGESYAHVNKSVI